MTPVPRLSEKLDLIWQRARQIDFRIQTDGELAEFLRLAPSNISDWRKKKGITDDYIDKVAGCFGLTREDLCLEDGEDLENFKKILKSKFRKRKWAAMLGIFVMVILASLGAWHFFTAGFSSQPDEYPEAGITKVPWDSYNAGDYVAATREARRCIHEFQGEAKLQQGTLIREGVPLPPVGMVAEEEKKKIFPRGHLNNTAACYFIFGRAEEELGKTEDAARAYQRVGTFPHARVWDPVQQIMWSPAEAAAGRLATLGETIP